MNVLTEIKEARQVIEGIIYRGVFTPDDWELMTHAAEALARAQSMVQFPGQRGK